MKLLLVVCCAVAGSLAVPTFSQGSFNSATGQQATAKDAVIDWANSDLKNQQWSSQAAKNGLNNADWGQASNTGNAKQLQSGSDYGSKASDWDQSASSSDRAANQGSQSGFSANQWAQNADSKDSKKDQLWTEGKQWNQGRRNNDDVNYSYDKKFDLKDSDNGGLEEWQASNSHALDELKDSASNFDRKVDQDAAKASAADKASANQKSLWGQSASSGASSKDNKARDSSSAASALGRDQDWSNKLDQSQGGQRQWADARQAANDLSKDTAAKDGAYKRQQEQDKQKDLYPAGLGYGQAYAPVGGYLNDGGKLNGNSFYGQPYGGKNLYNNAPYGGNGYFNNGYGKNLFNAPYGNNNAPFGEKNAYNNDVYGKNVFNNNPFGSILNNNSPFGKSLYNANPSGKDNIPYDSKSLFGDNLYGFGLAGAQVLSAKPSLSGKVSDGAQTWDHNSKAGLRQWDNAAQADQTQAKYNKDQWLQDQNKGYERDAKNAAWDKSSSDWAQQGAQSANKADQAQQDSANAWNKNQAQSIFDEDLWKKEAESKRLSDRSQDKKIYKKWFNNKNSGGDNKERLLIDRDQAQDAFGTDKAAKKDWAQSSEASQSRSAADANGKNAWNARQAAWDKDAQQKDWKKDASGWQNANAASKASDGTSGKGWQQQQWKDNTASQAADSRAQKAQAWDRDASGANAATAADSAFKGYPANGLNSGYGFPAKGYGYNTGYNPGFGYNNEKPAYGYNNAGYGYNNGYGFPSQGFGYNGNGYNGNGYNGNGYNGNGYNGLGGYNGNGYNGNGYNGLGGYNGNGYNGNGYNGLGGYF